MIEFRNPDKIYHHGSHIVYSCTYHVVFCPKYRRKVLVPPVDGRLKELFNETAEKYGFSIIEMEVMPEHVHMIIDCNPEFGIAAAVRKLKGCSSRVLREEFPHLKSRIPTLWTRGAFISSVGCVSLDAVRRYIEEQKTS